jgi:hypothetical protein
MRMSTLTLLAMAPSEVPTFDPSLSLSLSADASQWRREWPRFAGGNDVATSIALRTVQIV